MSTATAPRIEIFRVGKHTAASGAQLEFSAADLAAIASAYDPALSEAPLCVGHPKDNLPAYGWAQSLALDGDVLFMQPHQVDPEFAEMVNAGRFKKRSAAFYGPDDKHNPKPGTFYLRHVAFLGAQPPAVKGLRDVQFAEDDTAALEFGEAPYWAWSTVGVLLRGVREWLIGKEGLDAADKVLPNYYLGQLDDAAAAAREPATAEATPLFNEGAPPVAERDDATRAAALAAEQAREAALNQREAALAARAAQLDAAEATAHRGAMAEFAEGLVKQGRLLPKDKAAVVALLVTSPKAEVLEFGEGDALVSKPALQVLQDFLSGLPKLVEFGEVAGSRKKAAELDTDDANAIAQRAVQFQEAEAKEGRTVSIDAAVQHVMDTHKDESAGTQ